MTILRRRWKSVAAGLMVGLVVAGVLVFAAPSRSTAVTTVNVNLISSNAFSAARPASDLIDAQTEQAMARSTVVMTEVAQELGSPWTKSSVRAAAVATLLPDGTVLRVEFTASDPRDAATGAALVAQRYLDYRSDDAQGRVDVASERLIARRDSLNKQLAAANLKVTEAGTDSAQRLSAEMARQTITDELTTVTTQLNELRGVNTSGGTVLTEADPGQVETSPNRPLIMGSGLLGGILLGLVLAFVANVLDRKVRDSYDVAGAGGGVTVARLAGTTTELPAEGDDGDQVRALRERLMAAIRVSRPVFTVVEVGVRDRSPSDLAPNLAVALADSGMSTDLILADFPGAALDQVLTALKVTEIESLGSARRFRGEWTPSLTILVPQRGLSRLTTDDIVADLLVEGVRTAEVTVVGVGQSAGPAVRLAAGRLAHQVVLAVEEWTTRIDDLADVVTDLNAVWAEIHGTVMVAPGRHFGASESDDVESFGPWAGTDSATISPAAAGDVEEWESYVAPEGTEPEVVEPEVVEPEVVEPEVVEPEVVEPEVIEPEVVEPEEVVEAASPSSVQARIKNRKKKRRGGPVSAVAEDEAAESEDAEITHDVDTVQPADGELPVDLDTDVSESTEAVEESEPVEEPEAVDESEPVEESELDEEPESDESTESFKPAPANENSWAFQR